MDYHIKIECSANDEEAEALYQDVRSLTQKYNDVISVNKCDFWSQAVNNVCEFYTTEVEGSALSQLDKLEEFIKNEMSVKIKEEETIVETAIRILGAYKKIVL